jgi:hypothetical protein
MSSTNNGAPVESATLLMLTKEAFGWVEAWTGGSRPQKWVWTE